MDLFTFSLCLTLIYTFVTILLNSKKNHSKLPPGPIPFPVIGNLLALGNKPHKSLAKLASIHGPIMTLRLGQVTTIVISSTSMARQVLQKHDLLLSNRTIPDSNTSMNHHQFAIPWLPVSPIWKNLRRICNVHLFSAQKLNANQHLRSDKVRDLISYIQESCLNGVAVDIGEAAVKTSLNLLSSTIFSINLADQSSEFAKEFKKLVSSIMEEAGKPNVADYFPILRILDPQGAKRRMTVHFTEMIDLFDRLVDQRLKLRNGSSCNGPKSVSNDMMDTLIDIMENDNEEIQREHILHLFVDLFTAGTDTSSSTIEWAMTELLYNPEVLYKAKEELDQNIGKGKLVEEQDIVKLPFLQAVIKETLRLHPPAPLLLPRKATQDVEISGFTVPKGAQVLVNAWAIGRDPNTWVDKPESFVPERFLGLEHEIDFKGRNFELIPFGAGRRICPGLPLADRIMHMIIGSLVNMFNWKLEDGIAPKDLNMEDKFGLTLQMANPLRAIPMPL